MSNGDPDLFSDQIGIKICFYLEHILDGLFEMIIWSKEWMAWGVRHLRSLLAILRS